MIVSVGIDRRDNMPDRPALILLFAKKFAVTTALRAVRRCTATWLQNEVETVEYSGSWLLKKYRVA
ncbi:MAG TPA: hypothetical protein VGW97_04470, partial [Chthoniobacterales bacterium]|nr:hypothetical protein [Chthoniobacterales bacterium]